MPFRFDFDTGVPASLDPRFLGILGSKIDDRRSTIDEPAESSCPISHPRDHIGAADAASNPVGRSSAARAGKPLACTESRGEPQGRIGRGPPLA
jgi:hypothetical protein